MAWTAPMTAVANSVFTAAQFNTYVRDNLNECAPAKATASGRLIVTTGTNAIAERLVTTATVSSSETTTSTTYTDLATSGPAVTVTTGTHMIALFAARMQNSTADADCFMSVEVSGATSISANDSVAQWMQGPAAGPQRAASFFGTSGLTAGSNVITAKYRVDGGTGTFNDRRLTVMAL